MDDRVIRVKVATGRRPSARHGIIYPFHESNPVAGKSPRDSDSISMSIRLTQKDGMDAIIMASVVSE